MREILFRGKRMNNGEWVEGFLLKSGEAHRSALRDDLPFSDCYIFPVTDRDIVRDFLTETIRLNLGAYHVIPETVSQFVGLCDKDGKKIFEGDIVQFQTRGSTFKPLYVRWYEECAQFIVTERDGFRSYPMDRSWRYEILGNVCDNIELLREVDNG